jgi:myosin heavy subunit
MQTGKTSSTEIKLAGRPPVVDAVHDVTKFDPLDELVFSLQDPNAVTRDNIANAARKIFGAGPESADFIAKLVEHMMSVSESRSRVVAELIVLGGHLSQMMKIAISHHTGKVGDSEKARRKGATLCFDFFQLALKITRPSAYNYMRCNQRFADDAEAVKIFSFGELNLLAAPEVTDAQIEIIKERKNADPKMVREDVAAMLKELQSKNEAIVDRDKQLENLEGLLADNKLQLDVSVRENRHLMERLAGHERSIADQDISIANLQELLSQRTSGYPALEQELAAKNRALAEKTEELKALRAAKPKTERVEVPVETLPDAYKNLADACKDALGELTQLGEQKDALAKEIESLRADVAAQQSEREAATAVKNALDDLTNTWGEVSSKMATVQLAVQASSNPEQYNPTLEALGAAMRKTLSEVEAALNRKAH